MTSRTTKTAVTKTEPKVRQKVSGSSIKANEEKRVARMDEARLKLQIGQLELRLEKNNKAFKAIQQALGNVPADKAATGTPFGDFVTSVFNALEAAGRGPVKDQKAA